MFTASLPACFRAARRLLSRRRFWVSLGVSALWLAVMGLIWARESGRMGGSLRQMGVSPEVLLVSWIDYEQWMWIEQNGRRIGLTHMSIKPDVQHRTAGRADRSIPGYRLLSHTRLSLRMLGLEVPLDLETDVGVNAAFELETMQTAVHALGRELLMQAFAERNQLYYRIKVGSAQAAKNAGNPILGALLPLEALGGAANLTTPRDLCGRSPLAEPIFLTDAVIPILTRTETLRAGERWTTRASDPLQGLFHSDVQVKVEGTERLKIGSETIDAWRLTEQIGSLRSTVWYDLRGRIVQRELGSGVRLVQANPAQALDFDKRFDRPYPFAPIERDWIRQHLDPTLKDKPLSALLPQMPAL